MHYLMASLLLLLSLTTNAFAKTQIETFFTDIDIQHPQSGISQVDCIYVINLDYRPQKWIQTKNAFNKFEIFPNRVNAINGWKLSEEEKQLLSGDYPLRLRGGQIGCILSHLSILQDAFNRNLEVIWVCEDDIEICENPHQMSALISKLSEIDPEWDVLYTDIDSKNSLGEIVPSLGADFRPDYPHQDLSYYIQREPIDETFLKIHQRFGAYSLIISKRGIAKILQHFIDHYLWTAYDIDIHYVDHIRQYCISREIVSINYKTPSDTELTAEN